MPDPATVQLITRAEVPSAEILVLDSRFQFVTRAIGALDVALAPGVYTVQYKAGSSVADVPVVLRPGAGSVTLPSPALTIWSPAPLAGTEAGERYGEFARQQSREVHHRAGAGGQLFVFVRAAAQDRTRTAAQLFDVVVGDASGRPIVNLIEHRRMSPDGLALACTLELTPGTYLLRYQAGDTGPMEQAFVVGEGWQTQVFASSRPFAPGSAVLGPNFPEAAVLMAALDAGFDSADPAVRRAEAARQGLAENRRVAPEAELRAAILEAQGLRRTASGPELRRLLRQKFGNPMLGIYGAHLALLSPERSWDLLRDVVVNLRDLAGDHPDVMALTTLPELRDLGAGGTYGAPPMLRSSWRLVLEASTQRPDLVPTGSYASALASRTWGAGAWLCWRPPTAPGTAQREVSLHDVGAAIVVVQQRVLENLRALGPGVYSQKVAADQRLTDTERALLLYAIATASQGTRLLAQIHSHGGLANRVVSALVNTLKRFKWTDVLTGGLTLAPLLVAHLGSDRLVRALGVPLGTLNQAIVSLAGKLAADRS